MKQLLVVVLLLAFSSGTRPARAQTSDKELPEGYYIVIGAFGAGKEDYARRFAESADKNGQQGAYGFNRRKNLYFTYLDYSPDFKEALSSMRGVRATTSYVDAWVFVCHPGDMTKTVLLSRQDEDTPALPEKKKNSAAEENPEDGMARAESTVSDQPDSALEADSPETTGYEVAFILSNARNDAEVEGDVQYIDTERARLIDVYHSGDTHRLEPPGNGTGDITLLCDVFGFRKEQKDLNYATFTTSEDVKKMDDFYVVFFDLVRYHKGDIVTMYNVYFFNDAAVMRPESRYEVNSLLAMMEENPNYKIRIHGHTNGRRAGKIISRGKSAEFFSLEEGNKESVGSSKKLSRERAMVIRDYLISRGVDEKRMEIKAWGGRRMLYDKNSPQAKKNVRVEIEILEE